MDADLLGALYPLRGLGLYATVLDCPSLGVGCALIRPSGRWSSRFPPGCQDGPEKASSSMYDGGFSTVVQRLLWLSK